MSKIYNIITNPNPILRKKSEEIKPEKISNKNFQDLCDDMILTMKKKDGVGLAAPQIGKNIRLVIVNTKDGPVCAINPKIIKKSLTKAWDDEGCLSVPNTYGKVKRFKKIKCTYLDKTGKKIMIKAEGMMARVFQHEIDHLDGILFIDKAKDIKKIEEN